MTEFENVYAFWDLIMREAYLPEDAILRANDVEKFKGRETGKNVFLFGCNDAAREVIRLFSGKVRIKGILDNDPEKRDTEVFGVKVFAPDERIPKLREEQDVIVITMRLHADEVAEQITALGFSGYYGLGVLLAGIPPYRDTVEQTEAAKKRPPEDIIMMESTNDFDGNSGALYEYLKERNAKHRFVWIVKKEKNRALLKDKNDLALCPKKNVNDLKQYIYYLAAAKWQIWDNTSIPKRRPDQINVYLQHTGMGYKLVTKYYTTPDWVDYLLSVNEFVYEHVKRSLCFSPKTKVIYGGLPRNDVLLSGEWHELEKLTDKTYDKVIVWAPTFRQSAYGERSDFDREYPYGIPVLYTGEDMKRLSDFLAENNILLILKLHPSQRHNYTEGGLENILYLDGDAVKKVHFYKLMTQADAMISDYSSIVFDFMLLDRPIAWTLDDLDSFKLEFLMDNPDYFMPGEKIYDGEGLFTFLSHVKNGEDIWKKEREEVSEKCNASKNMSGCENLVRALGL